MSINGMRGDGKLTAAAGAIAAVLLLTGALTASRALLNIGTLIAGLGGAVAVYDLFNISRMVEVDGPVTSQVGFGLYLCAAGGIAAVVLGLIAPDRTPA